MGFCPVDLGAGPSETEQRIDQLTGTVGTKFTSDGRVIFGPKWPKRDPKYMPHDRLFIRIGGEHGIQQSVNEVRGVGSGSAA